MRRGDGGWGGDGDREWGGGGLVGMRWEGRGEGWG